MSDTCSQHDRSHEVDDHPSSSSHGGDESQQKEWNPEDDQEWCGKEEWNVVKISEVDENNERREKRWKSFEIEEEPENVPKSSQPAGLSKFWRSLLTFCGIAIAAIIGVFIRIGFGYYRIWKIETNYSLMYCQIVGCFIMGYALKLKFHRYEFSQNHIVMILFTAITTGLCGSITSFSGWQLQCNRNFFLQWDLSWGNVGGSYNGGRLLEWFVCMWGGIVVPLSALHLGFYVSTKLHPPLPEPPERSAATIIKPPSVTLIYLFESLLLFIFCISIVLVVIVPVIYYPNWIFLSYSAVLGIAGAYTRFLLSDLNSFSTSFPYGTFVANVVGTWIASLILVLSKYFVEYYDIQVQSILYGILTGFCGGLTTVSTLVKELDALPPTEGYIYSIATHSVSQLGIILILNVYTYLTVPSSSVMPPPIDMCKASHDLCHTFLNSIDCPWADRKINSCDGSSNYDNFQGVCSCGQYTTDRITLILVDSQIKSNITSSMVTVWPTDSESIKEPTEVYDFCLTYENVCLHFLDRIDCPVNLRRTFGCDKQGLSNFAPMCECGGLVAATLRIKDALVDISLSRRYDILPYTGYPTLISIDFEAAYLDLCSKMMDHIQCPKIHRCMSGNLIPENYSTWIGLCICNYYSSCKDLEENYLSSLSYNPVSFHDVESPSTINPFGNMRSTQTTEYRAASPHHQVDFSVRIAKNIFDALLRPNYQLLLVRPNITSSNPMYDLCGSYYQICLFFLEKISCPVELQYSTPCGVKYNSSIPDYDPQSGEYLYPHGKIQNATSYCRCGNMNVLDSRSFELVITGILSQVVNEKYLYLPSPSAPYSLAISSDPYRQLIQPRHILPL